MSEYLNFTSPKGTAVYPHLNKPSNYGKYEVSLNISEEEFDELMAQAKELALDNFGNKRAAKAKVACLKKTEDGDFQLKATTKDQPKVVDRKGNEINPRKLPKIGGGSKLKIEAAFKAYDNEGKLGVTCYLNAVQLIELKEFQGRSAFKEEEGSYEADDSSDDTSDDDTPSKGSKTAAEPDDDDIPF